MKNARNLRPDYKLNNIQNVDHNIKGTTFNDKSLLEWSLEILNSSIPDGF